MRTESKALSRISLIVEKCALARFVSPSEPNASDGRLASNARAPQEVIQRDEERLLLPLGELLDLLEPSNEASVLEDAVLLPALAEDLVG